MKNTAHTIALLGAGMLVSALLAGCSGGSSGSADHTPSAVKVTPSLGKFSVGTAVNLRKIDNSLLGSGTVVADGTSTITLPAGYSGPIVVEVLGGTGVTYYDEKANAEVPFGSGKKLRACMPSVKTSVGVTPLTHAAVAKLEAASGALAAATMDSIGLANTKVAAAFGLSDILLPPTPVSATTGATLNIAKLEDKYALVLAALAKTSASDAAAAADALALDIKDDKLNSLDGTTPLTAYTPANIATEYQNAAATFMDTTSQTVVADHPIVIVTDVSAIVIAPNQSDVNLAKAMFADLRTTATSLSNVTNSGFLDTKATSMSADLTANVGPDMEKVINRLEALGYAAESLDDYNNNYLGFSTDLDPTTNTAAMARGKGSIDSAMYGWGGLTYCWSASAAPITTMSCIVAGSNSGVFTGLGNTGTLKMVQLDITKTTTNTYSYTATRKNMPVTFNSMTFQWQPSGTLTSAVLPVGNGTYSGTADGSGNFLTGTLAGTMPPSSTKTDPITGVVSVATGLDHFSVTGTRSVLATPANSSRFTLVGTVSSDSLANPPTTNATFSFDAGTYLDVQQTTVLDAYGQTIGKLLSGKVIGTYKTAATQFRGTIDLGASVMDASNTTSIITSITAKGTISEITGGVVGDILSGTIAMTEANAGSFNALLPISSSNYHQQNLSFTGTVQAPSRPLMTLVVASNMTSYTTSSVTLNYSYGTISITGSSTVNSANLTNTLTLSNQDGVQVVISSTASPTAPAVITGVVNRSSAKVADITGSGMINYVDGFSETLN